MLCKQPYCKVTNPRTKPTDKVHRLAATPFGCGQCLPCRLNKSREWTARLLLENSTSADSAFLTLTYNDDHIHKQGYLVPEDLTKFIKRYRRKNEPTKIRYFAVGEYGTATWRPHYHLAVFGDNELFNHTLESIWGKGFTQAGDFSQHTAKYITGYIAKKLSREYNCFLGEKPKEFMRCSTHNGGIGYGAIRRIAQALKKEKTYDNRILREVSFGKKKLPLGRYLTKKLAEELGIQPSQFERDFENHQEEIFNNYLTSDGKFIFNIIEDNKPKRLAMEKRSKIYKQKRIL